MRQLEFYSHKLAFKLGPYTKRSRTKLRSARREGLWGLVRLGQAEPAIWWRQETYWLGSQSRWERQWGRRSSALVTSGGGGIEWDNEEEETLKAVSDTDSDDDTLCGNEYFLGAQSMPEVNLRS